jgi:hypothetical protein
LGWTLKVAPPTVPDNVGLTVTPAVPTAISAESIGSTQAESARKAIKNMGFMAGILGLAYAT